jgi:tetratricopeptide (TPR) repeat protein
VDRDCRELSLLGLGGTGKTQVALQFAYHVKETQPDCSVFWVSAVSMASFEQACLAIAEKLDILQAENPEEDPKELVRQHLSSNRAGPWLLIVDNADDLNIFFGDGQSQGIASYLPQSETGLIVYTTRTPEVAEQACRDIIEVGAMNRQDAMDFLKKSLRNKKHMSNDAVARELLDELAHLPLAIAQAAAYLNRNSTPIQRYLRLLRNTEKDMVSLLRKEFQDNTRYKESANAVATTWVVSFNQIHEHHRSAADLLGFMSCIESKAIPRSLLPPAQSEVDMENAIGILCGYSLITRRGDDENNSGQEDDESVVEEGCYKQEEQEEWYDIHRLVHLATKVWSSEYGDAANVVTKALRHVKKVFPGSEWENRELWRSYFPHALRILASSKDCNVSEKSALCLSMGRCLVTDKRLKEAIELLGECCRLRDVLGEDDPGRLTSQHELARAYYEDGQVQKAVELLEHVVKVRDLALAEGHHDRLASQHELARAYHEDGQVQKTVELLEHVVKVRDLALAEGHPSRLASQHELARAYLEDGQVQKAVELLEHVVRVEEALAEGHPDRLASQHVLARAYLEDGQVQKAVELLEHVVRVQEALAEGHPDRLVSQHVLATAYLKDGQVQKAVELLEHVVRVREALAEGHPDRLASQHVLARAYLEDGQVEKAVELLEHVVKVRDLALAEGHHDRLASQHELARAYLEDGQVQKAVELLEHVVRVEEALAEGHPSRLASQHELATAYLEDGQVQKAVELLEHVVRVEEALVEGNPSRLASQHELATAYYKDGQVQRAVDMLEHVVEVEARVLRDGDPSRMISVELLQEWHAEPRMESKDETSSGSEDEWSSDSG